MVTLVVFLIAACGSGGSPERRVVEALPAERIEVGGAPWGVVADGAGAWVTDASRATVLRLDAAGAVVRELPTAAPDPRDAGLAMVGSRLWIANLGGTVGVLDVDSGEAVSRVAVGPGEPAAVAPAGDGGVWVPLHGPGGGLARLATDPAVAAPRRTELPESGFSVAVVAGRVWVGGLDRRLVSVDAASGEVERTVDLGGAPRGVAIAAGDVWVSLRDAGTVVRVDGESGEELERISIDGQPWPVAAGGGFVWVATGEGRLLRIDPGTDRVTGAATVGPNPRAIAVADDAVWVASQSGVVARIALSRR